jgi:hypothetical protein
MLAVGVLGVVGAAWACGIDDTRAVGFPEGACERQADCAALGAGYRCVARRCEEGADRGRDAAVATQADAAP